MIFFVFGATNPFAPKFRPLKRPARATCFSEKHFPHVARPSSPSPIAIYTRDYSREKNSRELRIVLFWNGSTSEMIDAPIFENTFPPHEAGCVNSEITIHALSIVSSDLHE